MQEKRRERLLVFWLLASAFGIMFAGWVCFILPGPLYVHLSYAPRWRIIDRLDRDLRPFEGMIRTIDSPDSEEVVVTEDDELEEVVDES